MQEIIDENLIQKLVDRLYETYEYKINGEEYGGFIGLQQYGYINPFDKDIPFAVFDVTWYKPWTEKQEKHINTLLGLMADKNIYAIDWNHGFFVFNPRQEFCSGQRNDNKILNYYNFFPDYYSDGDTHLFIDMDWQYGIIRPCNESKLYVFGERLIKFFQLSTKYLEIKQVVS